jgi:ribose 5-phosphate isomerase RpiB
MTNRSKKKNQNKKNNAQIICLKSVTLHEKKFTSIYSKFQSIGQWQKLGKNHRKINKIYKVVAKNSKKKWKNYSQWIL